ncbi:hypothetical protein ACFPQ7_09895, partial [Methylobacterium iners]|uniref:hypothetical protein n=1 Tax=Methylobacterium iners TaxID=418707 RepID=UPI0036106C19
MLVGVLVQLNTPEHEHLAGGWFAEALFGRMQGLRPPPFDTLEEATRWFRHHMKSHAATA